MPKMDVAAAKAWATTTDKIVYFYSTGDAKPALLDKLDGTGLEADTIEDGFNATRYRSKTLVCTSVKFVSISHEFHSRHLWIRHHRHYLVSVW